MHTPNPNNFFVFDMDNTLIKTDKANNLAYTKALSSVLGINYTLDNCKRFTRKELKDIFPYLPQTQIDEIVTRKELYFESFLTETELNLNLFELLKQLRNQRCQTILLTNSHSGRAISLCNYYNLTKYFVLRFFREDCHGNKYSLLESLGFNLQKVVLFENEESCSLEAIKCGIKMENIIKVDF